MPDPAPDQGSPLQGAPRRDDAARDAPPRLSIIIPVLNEAAALPATLAALCPLPGLEVIVVDGGSDDATVALAARAGARVLHAARGRGTQLHAGALAARGPVLWFLHADTQPRCAAAAAAAIAAALQAPTTVGGYFRLRFRPHRDGRRLAPRFLTGLYPRLRWLGLVYGDSGIFLRRSTYHQMGGFAPLPLFEDLDLLRRLRRCGHVARLAESLQTSSRRFEAGFPRTFGRWTLLQCLFWLGVSPHRLARHYPTTPRPVESGK